MPNRTRIGLDISLDHHDVAVVSPTGDILVRHRQFVNNQPGYQEVVRFLQEVAQQYPSDGLDLAGEATGLLWWHTFYQLDREPALADLDLHLFLLNPAWVAHFKKALPPQDKLDRNDGLVVARYLITQSPDHPWHADDRYLALQRLTRYRAHLTLDLSREKLYYLALLYLKASEYQRLKTFSDVFGVTSQALLEQYPTLDALADIPLAELVAQLQQHGRGRFPHPERNAQLLHQVAQDSYPLAEVLVQPVHQILHSLAQHIQFLEKLRKPLDADIAAQVANFADAPSLRSIPGLGPVYTAGLLAEIQDIQRFRTGQKWDPKRQAWRAKTAADTDDSLAKWAGLWWPRKASGRFEGEDRHLAKTGNAYLRYYLVEAADSVRRNTPEYGDYYQRKYAQSVRFHHQRALILTARKLLRLVVALLLRHELYSQRSTPTT